MNKIVAFLAKLGYWSFTVLFTVITLIISEFLVVLHSYLLTGSFFDKNLLIAGFTIPSIVGFVVFGLIAFLIRHLHELEDEKNKTIALQKDTEEKLRKSENYQRAILDSFPFLVWLKDTDSNFLAVNKPFAKAAGINNPSEIIGKNDLEFWSADLANAYRADDQLVMKSQQKKELEELIEEQGERRWHQTYKAPILDEDGNVFGTVGFARDITLDKESEEELQLMKHALDHVNEAVYLTGEDGIFRYVSDGAVRQLGYTKEEFKSIGIPDIDKNFSKAQLPTHWKKLKDNGSLTFQSTHQCKDNTIIPVEINSNYVEYRGLEFSLAFVRDITHRKKAEEKLKLSASVFTYTHEGILIADSDNNIVDVNEAFTTITGYSCSDVYGKNPKILQSGRNNKKFYTELWASLHKDGVWKGELWNRKKNGEEYAENATISIVYAEDKTVQNYISIFTDITLEKRQRQELEHHAHYDVLTNLPNRMLFADRMKQAIAQAIRNNKLIDVAYIDIDGFKQVNDTCGHTIGDKLLILLAQKMTILLRQSDTVSRVGGDEFIALIVNISNEDNIIPFLDRLVDTVSQPITIDSFSVNVSASIGVTFYPQKEKLEAEQIIKQADKAMYRAKMAGKNRYVIFNPKEDSIE